MKKKILIKYENIYLLLIIPFMIYQIITHINNNIAISNLITEIIILSIIYSLVYTLIKYIRTNKKTISNLIKEYL